jgi:hypothetical protein
MQPALISYLQTELQIPKAAINLALRRRLIDEDPLPMILWQYGLVTLDQLTHIFNWLSQQASAKIPYSL